MPFTWEEGVIIDNAISTINQSNTTPGSHQRSASVKGVDQNAASNNAAGEGSSKNLSGAGLMVTSDHLHSSPTPPLQRRLAKSFSVAPSHSQSKGFYPQILIITFKFLCSLMSAP